MNVLKYMIIVVIFLCIIPAFSSCKNSDTKTKIESSAQDNYVLTIKDNTLCLLNNKELIKEYNVNISVLPGEDLKLLVEGIPVKNLSDADSIAENFDG